jgi:hypothetical protein
MLCDADDDHNNHYTAEHHIGLVAAILYRQQGQLIHLSEIGSQQVGRILSSVA